MNDIVATIQRDQNAIIRNETSHVIIIQGVAGSGKTPIALHKLSIFYVKEITKFLVQDTLAF
jgi:DNA helicase II / ATP-dependent DNA helicase PcrA